MSRYKQQMEYTFPTELTTLDKQILIHIPTYTIELLYHLNNDYTNLLIDNKLWYTKLAYSLKKLVAIKYEEHISYHEQCIIFAEVENKVGLLCALGSLDLGEDTYSYLFKASDGTFTRTFLSKILLYATNTGVISNIMNYKYKRISPSALLSIVSNSIDEKLNNNDYKSIIFIYSHLQTFALDISSIENTLKNALRSSIYDDNIEKVQFIIDPIRPSAREKVVEDILHDNIQIRSIEMVEYLVSKFYKLKDDIAQIAIETAIMIGYIYLIIHITNKYKINIPLINNSLGYIYYHINTLEWLVDERIITNDNVKYYIINALLHNQHDAPVPYLMNTFSIPFDLQIAENIINNGDIGLIEFMLEYYGNKLENRIELLTHAIKQIRIPFDLVKKFIPDSDTFMASKPSKDSANNLLLSLTRKYGEIYSNMYNDKDMCDILKYLIGLVKQYYKIPIYIINTYYDDLNGMHYQDYPNLLSLLNRLSGRKVVL